jgi:hypothetical protein
MATVFLLGVVFLLLWTAAHIHLSAWCSATISGVTLYQPSGNESKVTLHLHDNKFVLVEFSLRLTTKVLFSKL